MDYRSYENKVNETKNDIIGFLSLKTTKVHDYSTSIVETYFDSLNNGDISIKSFKLKIIHNEHANEKNTLEFSELLKNNYEEFKVFLENFFLDYEKNLKSYKYFPTRKSDLLQVNNPLKRKKQENITKINNFDINSAFGTTNENRVKVSVDMRSNNTSINNAMQNNQKPINTQAFKQCSACRKRNDIHAKICIGCGNKLN